MDAIIDETLEQNEFEKTQKTWANKVLPLRGYVHPEGVMIGEHSGLVLVTGLTPLPLDGLGAAQAEGHARAFEKQLNKLPESFSFHFWMDRARIERSVEAVSDERGPMVQELERSRAIQVGEEPEYENRIYMAVEHHGNFAFGGPEVGVLEGLTSGMKALFTRDYQKRQEHVWQFKAILPGSEFVVQNALQNRMLDDIETLLRETKRFCGSVYEAVQPEIFSQEGEAALEHGLRMKVLDPRESYVALHGIGDHRARGRAHAQRLSEAESLLDLKYITSLPDYLAAGKPDFAVAFGRRGEDGRVHRVGQFCYGGQPRKTYEIRALPEEVPAELFSFLSSFDCPLTYRVRWEPYSDAEAKKRMKEHERGVGSRRMFQKAEDKDLGKNNAKAEFMDLKKVLADGARFGRMSILISLAGVEGKDPLGRVLPASENLELACKTLEEKLQKLDIEFDEELEHQNLAFVALYPGSIGKARLGHLDVTSDVFTNVLTLHDHYVPQPEITEFEHKTPWLLTVDRSGRRTRRSLVTGKVMNVFVCGGMGKGKSFWINQNASGFFLSHPKAGVDIIERGGSGAATARNLGGAAIPMGDPSVPGKYNPFDVEVGPEGYDPITTADLLNTIQACLGREDYEPQELEAMRRALLMVGTTSLSGDEVGPGQPAVRSLDLFAKKLGYVSDVGRRLAQDLNEFRSDLDSRGSMWWVFPPVQNEADKAYVCYYFPVTPIDARAECLQLMAILQKIRRRVDGKHPHSVWLDEANSFLDITVEDPKRRAAANILGRVGDDGYTQYRKLGGGFVICSQFPTHLNNWRPSLADNIRKNTGTWVVLGMSEKGLEELQKFGATESVLRAAGDIRVGAPYFEHCVIAGGVPWIERAPEGWYGRALNESGAEPARVKNLMLDKMPGDFHVKTLAFEKALRAVSARRTTWADVEQRVMKGDWS